MSSKKKACRFIRIDRRGRPKKDVNFDYQIPSIPNTRAVNDIRRQLWKQINDTENALTVEKIASWHHKTLGHENSLRTEVKELFRSMIEWAVGEVNTAQ